MTLTLAPDERAGNGAPPVRVHPPARTGGTSSWRLAARLARREVRRRPGRTALVMTLIAVPVAAMTFAGVAARTIAEPPEESFAREFGRADVVVQGDRVDAAQVLDALPGVLAPTATLFEWRESYEIFVPSDVEMESVSGQLQAVDLADPMVASTIDVVAGRVATAPGEALVSEHLAQRWDLVPGDMLVLDGPALRVGVVGVAVFRRDIHLDVVALSADAPIRSLPGGRWVLADLARPLGLGELQAMEQRLQLQGSYPRAATGGREVGATELAWGWVGGALALAVLGIVVTAAFATSARRQLVTLGQLAANGAGPKLLRRTLALQGMWSGLLGSALGMAGGVGAVVALRGTIVRANRWDPGPYVVAWTDLAIIAVTGVVAATIAAFVPARHAARIPVLAALAGRRPSAHVHRRLVPIGLAAFAGGVLMLGAVAAQVRDSTTQGDLLALGAIIGGLAVLAGVCCASPLVAAAFGRLADHVRGAGRLAARGLARASTRTASVVAGIAAVGAAALAVAMVAETVDAGDGGDARALPSDVLLVNLAQPQRLGADFGELVETTQIEDLPRPEFSPLDVAARTTIERAFPDADIRPLLAAVYDPAPYDMREAPPGWPYVDNAGLVGVADDTLLELLGLSDRDRAALSARGAIYIPPGGELFRYDGRPFPPAAEVDLPAQEGPITVPFAVVQDRPATTAGSGGLLVTPETAARLGLDVVEYRLAVNRGDAIDDGDRRRIADLEARLNLDADERGYVSIWTDQRQSLTPRTVGALVVLGVGLLALGVVGVALWLTAAESRGERRLLKALGASPQTARATTAVEAWLLVTAGMVLAAPTGLIPTAVVQQLSEQPWDDRSLHVPWAALGGLVVVLPLVAAGAAWALTAVGDARRRDLSAVDLAAD